MIGTAQPPIVGGKYHLIEIAGLRVNTIPDFDLYLVNEKEKRYVLYRTHNTPFGEPERQRLLENKVKRLFVSTDDRNKHQRYQENNLPYIIRDKTLSVQQKAQVVYQSAAGRVRQVLDNPTSSEGVKRSRHVVENVVKFVLTDTRALDRLISLSTAVYEVYTHSVNVCTYGLALARHLGISDLGDLRDLGTGLLLHDCGKSKVPKDILRKPDRLDPQEWKLMRRHPLWGYELLQAAGSLNPRVLEIVRYHHESADGSGYPNGLPLIQIPHWAMICRLADVFDALTTNRCYKASLRPFEALQTMCREMSEQLDPRLLTELIVLLGPGRSFVQSEVLPAEVADLIP